MVEIDWAILCDYAFLDMGRKTCMIGVFQRIFAANVPATHHQSALVIRFSGQPGATVKFKAEVVRPVTSGQGTLATFNGETKLGDIGTAEFTANIVGLPLPDYGDYSFNIYVDDELKKAVVFTVAPRPKQLGATPTPPAQS